MGTSQTRQTTHFLEQQLTLFVNIFKIYRDIEFNDN